MQDGLRIRLRGIDVAALLQTCAQGSVVVNLSVEDEPDVFGAASHRLMSGFREINDRETAKAEAAARVVKEQRARIIRPAMLHLVAHPFNERTLNAPARCSVLPDSTDATHVKFATL